MIHPNLPPDAMPWARAIEAEIAELERSQQSSANRSESENRNFASQSAMIGSQIQSVWDQANEIQMRERYFLFGTGVSVTGGTSGAWNSASTTLTVPGSSGTRSARVELEMPISGSSTGGLGARAYYRITSDGQLLSATSLGTSGFSFTYTIQFLLTVPEAGRTLTIELFATQQFDPSPFVVTLDNFTGNATLFNEI